jgi:hypothetical protein
VTHSAIVQPIVAEVGDVPGAGAMAVGAVAGPVINGCIGFVADNTIFRKVSVGELFDFPSIRCVAICTFTRPQVLIRHIVKMT